MPTNFNEIIFDQKYHSYTYHGHKLASVTRTVNTLKPPFDRDGLATAAARKRGVDVATILAEWDAARDRGMARGTQVHEWIARKLNGYQPSSDDVFLALNDKLPEMSAFDVLWQHLDTMTQVHAVEWVVGDAGLGIAGIIDAVLLDTKSGEYNLWDWKTGKAFTEENQFQNLLPPFDDLDDCDLYTYSLQISTYRLIVERNTDLVVGDCYIVHFDQFGTYQIHKALDLRERVEKWLTTVTTMK